MRFFCLMIVVLSSGAMGQYKSQRGLDPNKSLTQYSDESWQVEQGLPQNSVTALAQTPDGYIWIGTQEGLVRFDGVLFTVFDKRSYPEFHSNYITALAVDEQGTLWIGTFNAGLLSYAKNSFHVTQASDGIASNEIRSLYVDASQTLWIGGRNGALSFRKGSVFATIPPDSVSPRITINAICRRVDGGIWLSTDTALYWYDEAGFHTMESPLLTPETILVSVLQTNSGTLWIGTEHGLVVGKPGQLHSVVIDKDFPGEAVMVSYQDRLGSVWIGTRKGLHRWENGQSTSHLVSEGFDEEVVISMLDDREGNLWVGTDGNGLHLFRDGTFTTFTSNEGLSNNMVWAIAGDRKNHLLIGSDGGVSRLDLTTLKIEPDVWTKHNGLPNNVVWSLLYDSRNRTWIGTAEGLCLTEGSHLRTFTTANGLQSNSVAALFEDSRGDVWIGTSPGGINVFGKNGLKSTTFRGAKLRAYVGAIAEDHSGRMWFGTDGDGIFVLQGDSLVRFTTAQGLANDIVQSVYVDGDNVVWIGTFGGGLSLYRDGRFTNITTRDGLFDDVVFQILEDDRQRLWMTSNKGVFQTDKQELLDVAEGKQTRIRCTVFGKEDGMKSVECNGGVQPAGARTADGRLWFPTNKGVVVTNPGTMRINPDPPSVVLERVTIDNAVLNPLERAMLEPGAERFEFHYTGLSFLAPRKIRFKYRLEGYETEWVDAGTRRAAYYTHLPAGEYTFRVLAANSDGVLNESGAAFSFYVAAHYYETTAFYFLFALAILFLGVTLYRIRLRQIQQRQQELERMVEERTRALVAEKKKADQAALEAEQQKAIAQEADRMKSALLSMAAHDLKNPLVSIKNMAQIIKEDLSAHGKPGELSDLIQQGSQKMIGLINDLLNLSAIESGELVLRKKPVDLRDVALTLVEANRTQASKKSQVIQVETLGTEHFIVSADLNLVRDALDNLLSNAIKYSPAGKRVIVRLTRTAATASVSVVDEGPGFSSDDKQLLYKKFVPLSAKPTAGESSTGLGLSIVKMIVELHGGTISLETEIGKGSTLTITLPLE